MPEHKVVIENLQKELLDPVETGTEGNARETSTQTTVTQSNPPRYQDPLMIDPPRRPLPGPNPWLFFYFFIFLHNYSIKSKDFLEK